MGTDAINRYFAHQAALNSDQIHVALTVNGHALCRTTHLQPALAVRVAKCKYPTAGELRMRRLEECTKAQQREAAQHPIYGLREARHLIETGRLLIEAPAEAPAADASTVPHRLRVRYAVGGGR